MALKITIIIIGIMYINKHIYVFERSSTIKVGAERVNQEKRLAEFAGYITLAGNQQ